MRSAIRALSGTVATALLRPIAATESALRLQRVDLMLCAIRIAPACARTNRTTIHHLAISTTGGTAILPCGLACFAIVTTSSGHFYIFRADFS